MSPYKGMIGIYGGTFDPIHFGHLNLVIEIAEIHELSEVWFCPAQINPHKLDAQPLSAEHRLKMIQLAIEEIPHLSVIDLEIKQEGPSYTVNTLKKIIEQEKNSGSNRNFCLIIGDDAIPGFFHWHHPDEIVKLVPILIGRRQLNPIFPKGDPLIVAALKNGMTKTKVMDICSTEIRARLNARRYCGHLVPAKVLDYIYANDLY